MSPLSIGESYMDVVKLIPALTRAGPVELPAHKMILKYET